MSDDRDRCVSGIEPDEERTREVSAEGRTVRVCLRYEQHSRASHGYHYAMGIAADAPRSPVSLHIRPQTAGEERHVAAGSALDLTTGEAAFDEAYVVEGAPADVILLWLDDEIRAQIRAAGPAWIKLGGTRLELHRDGWWPEHEQALTELAGAMVLRLPGAVERAKQAFVTSRSGCRGDPDGQIGKERAEKWRGELLVLAEVLQRRSTRRRWGVVLLLVGAVAALLLVGAAAGLLKP